MWRAASVVVQSRSVAARQDGGKSSSPLVFSRRRLGTGGRGDGGKNVAASTRSDRLSHPFRASPVGTVAAAKWTGGRGEPDGGTGGKNGGTPRDGGMRVSGRRPPVFPAAARRGEGRGDADAGRGDKEKEAAKKERRHRQYDARENRIGSNTSPSEPQVGDASAAVEGGSCFGFGRGGTKPKQRLKKRRLGSIPRSP